MRRYLFLALIAVLLLSRCGAPAAPVPPLPADSVTPETPTEPEPQPEPVPEPEDFVSVTDWIPGIHTELRYATDNNFTHQVIYSFSDAYLR